jgi:hypothetical protein
MKGITLTEEFVSQITGTPIAPKEVAAEPTKALNEEAVEDTHQCPLCESSLKEAISDEKLREHVAFVLSLINESEDVGDSESVDETDDLEDDNN